MKSTRRKFLKTLGAGSATLALGPRTFGRAGSEPVSLDFWDMRVGPEGTYADAAKKIVDKYNALNPKVSVSYELEEWSEWPQVFSVGIGGGIGPDVSTGGSYQAVQYYEQGDVVALDDVIADLKRTGDDKDFLSGTLEEMTYEGHIVGLPWGTDPRAIFYRKDLFAKAGVKPPGSWDELRSAAKAVTKDGTYGLVVAGAEVIGAHSLLLLMINNGGGLFTADGNLDLMNDRNVEAATFFSNLAKDGSIHPGSQKFVANSAREKFLGGQAMMIIDAAGLQSFLDQQDKIGVLNPPAAPHGDRGTVAWIPNLMLYKASKNPDAAKEFLKWWVGNNKALWTDGRCQNLPIRKSVLKDPHFQNNPILKTIAEEWVPIAKGLGSHKDGVFPFLATLDGYGPLLALSNDLIAGKDPEIAMQLAEERVKALQNAGSQR